MNDPTNPADRAEQHAVIMSLMTVPGREPSPPEAVLRYFGTTDGK